MNTSLRDQNEGKYWTPVNRLEGDSNDTRCRMNNQPLDIKKFKYGNGGNAISNTRLVFEKVHPSHKESSDFESGEECLRDQISW